MKLRGTLVTCLTVSLLGAGAAVAQQPSHEHGATAPQQPSAGSKPATPAQGDQAHHMQHMEMCRQMMGQGGMMGGGMGPGMMGGGGMMGMPMMSGDPKQQAEMLAMRGEMMKAMGDIMLKYAQRAQSTK